jgi:hypothetical protein
MWRRSNPQRIGPSIDRGERGAGVHIGHWAGAQAGTLLVALLPVFALIVKLEVSPCVA